MTRARVIVCGLLLLTVVGYSGAQKPPAIVTISPEGATKNLVKRVEPVYPQMEKISIEGKVVLRVIISAEGNVEAIKVVSGHPILCQAAMDAVKQWEYKPFLLNGEPVRVETIVEVQFSPEAHSKKLREESDNYFKEAGHCRSALARNDAQAEGACTRLVGIAEQLDLSLRSQRVDAYKLAGRALAKKNKFQEALASYQDELGIARVADLPFFMLVDAYHDVAIGFRAVGDLQQAQACYEAAQTLLEKARQTAGPGVERNGYSKALQSLLREYASLLREAGKTAEAEAAEAKALEIKVWDKNGEPELKK